MNVGLIIGLANWAAIVGVIAYIVIERKAK